MKLSIWRIAPVEVLMFAFSALLLDIWITTKVIYIFIRQLNSDCLHKFLKLYHCDTNML